MTKLAARRLVNAVSVAGLMVATACLAYAVTPRHPLTQQIGVLKLEPLIPESFGDWQLDRNITSGVVNPQQEAFINQIYSQTLSRTYFDKAGHRIMVSIAYGEDQRRQSALHYPEVCYPAQGFAIESTSTAQLDLPNGRLPVKRLVTVLNKQRYEPLTYWVVVGERHVEGAIGKKLALMRYGMKGQIADGFIFRVSSIGRDSAPEFQRQQRFIVDMMGALQPAGRARLSGL